MIPDSALSPAEFERRRLARLARRRGAVAAQERAEVEVEDRSSPRKRSALDRVWEGR